MKIFEKFNTIKERIKKEWLWKLMKKRYDHNNALFMTLYDNHNRNSILTLNFSHKTKKEMQNIIKTMQSKYPGRSKMLFLLNSNKTEITNYISMNRPFDHEDIINYMLYGEGPQFHVVHDGSSFAEYLIKEAINNNDNELLNKIISFEDHLSEEQILKLMTYLYGSNASNMINSAKLLNISPFEIKQSSIDISNSISLGF